MVQLSDIVNGQTIVHVPSFTLESGRELVDVPVAYKTWGKLNERRDNVMIICHAFTGSADVEDWWGPLMGPDKAFDASRYLIFCGNIMGSPYGSASSLSINPKTKKPYGPEFPLTTIRDDVRLHKIILDQLGVTSVAVVIGGSMGGMTALEWPLCSPAGYVRHIIPIATAARHSAWCISWGEAQRQSIYSDPLYLDGYYDIVDGQPKTGLAAARMAALLTYRSRDSFESRFGRKTQLKVEAKNTSNGGVLTPPQSPRTPADHALAAHNDGHRGSRRRPPSSLPLAPSPTSINAQSPSVNNLESNNNTDSHSQEQFPQPSIFAAQSYLRYQGDKFTARFDANCYIHISRKLDTHDLARNRIALPSSHTPEDEVKALHNALSMLPPAALVISIQTDGLFTPSEQREIASYIPGASLVTIPSPDGHDGFLLEFEAINQHILRYLHDRLPDLYAGVPENSSAIQGEGEGFEIKKTSMFGEAEADITSW